MNRSADRNLTFCSITSPLVILKYKKETDALHDVTSDP